MQEIFLPILMFNKGEADMAETKKQPQRMCIACRQMKDKKELVRFVKSGENVCLDKTGKQAGRGAYVCDSPECITKCIKTRALNRAFKANISEDVYNKLKEQI